MPFSGHFGAHWENPGHVPGFFSPQNAITPQVAGSHGNFGQKKAAPKSGFLYHQTERSVRGGAGSSRSDFSSSGSNFRSSRSGNSSGSFRSGRSNFRSSRSGCVSGLFSLLTASGQSHGSDQRSQQERLFHACVLKRSVNKTGGLGTMCKAHSPITNTRREQRMHCNIVVAPHSATDYTSHRAIT